VIRRFFEGRAGGGQARGVRGVRIATVGQIVLARFRAVLDRHRRVLDLVGAEEVGEVQFGRRAGLDADRGAVQFLGAFHALGLADDEALAIVIGRVNEGQLHVHVAHEGPCGVPEDHVAFLGVQQREPGLAGGRNELHLVAVTEDGCSDGPAHVGVKAGPVTVGVGVREPRKAGVHDAMQNSACLDVIKRCRLCPRGNADDRSCGGDNTCSFEHL